MIASTAILMYLLLMDPLGENINNEYAAVGRDKIHLIGRTTPKDATKGIYCIFYANFLKLKSLYSSTIFMVSKSDTEVDAEINTLYRLKICPR